MLSRVRSFSTRPEPPKSRFAPYRQALSALAERTRTPLPSLVFSFAVLHELTAIIPLAGFFFAARAFNVGDRLIRSFPEQEAVPLASASGEAPSPVVGWMRAKSAEWWTEGRQWAGRVGRRYGVFGMEKGGLSSGTSDGGLDNWLAERAAGDVVNAVVAYWLTKALLPARIGLSLYLSPAFSRRCIEPTRLAILKMFRRKTPSS